MRIGLDPAPGGHLYDDWQMLRQLVARFGVFLLMEYGLELIGGRRLDIVDIPLVHGDALADEDVPPVGAPEDTVAVIVALRAVLREHALWRGRVAGGLHDHIASLDISGLLPVGRDTGIDVLLLVYLHPVGLMMAAVDGRALRSGRDVQGLVHLFDGGVGGLRAAVGVVHDIAPALRRGDAVVQEMGGVFPRDVVRPVHHRVAAIEGAHGVGALIVLKCALGGGGERCGAEGDRE